MHKMLVGTNCLYPKVPADIHVVQNQVQVILLLTRYKQLRQSNHLPYWNLLHNHLSHLFVTWQNLHGTRCSIDDVRLCMQYSCLADSAFASCAASVAATMAHMQVKLATHSAVPSEFVHQPHYVGLADPNCTPTLHAQWAS